MDIACGADQSGPSFTCRLLTSGSEVASPRPSRRGSPWPESSWHVRDFSVHFVSIIIITFQRATLMFILKKKRSISFNNNFHPKMSQDGLKKVKLSYKQFASLKLEYF